MNRRQKIIVSVTGIFLVLLLLVGLTYAYFLTRITGNTNDKSISVSTANLAIVYGDGTTEILTKSGLMPGEVAGTKDFTVTNNGDTSEYVVYIDEVTVTDAKTNSVTEFKSNDFVYELKCTKSDGTECVGVEKGVFPMNNGILIGNRIEVGDTHTYEFKLTYLETGQNQTDDMNKTLSAKINIGDIKEHNTEDNPDIESIMNPYGEDTFAYTIINNAKNVTKSEKEKGYAELLATPKTTPAAESNAYKYESKGIKLDDIEEISLTVEQQNKYITYGTDYIIDGETGLVSLSGKITTCKYNEDGCYNNLPNKYILAGENYDEFLTETSTDVQINDMNIVFQVSEAPTSTTEEIVLKVYWFDYPTVATENILSVTNDDYGISYYFRGGVKNNYVNFNRMCWRIVRIEGDGSVRLLLEDEEECSSDTLTKKYTSYIGKGEYGTNGDLTNSLEVDYDKYEDEDSIKYFLNVFLNGGTFQQKDTSVRPNKTYDKTYIGFSEDLKSKLKSVTQCLGTSKTLYDKSGNVVTNESDSNILVYKTAKRLFGYGEDIRASLVCDEESTKAVANKIFPLTADEIAFAGEIVDEQGTYINAGSYIKDNVEFYDNNKLWTITRYSKKGPLDYPTSLIFTSNLIGYNFAYSKDAYVRPAISLRPETIFVSGNGTVTRPYEIN